MSGKSIKKLGFRRGGDKMFANASQLTVIGADITVAALKKKYAGKAWACNVIQALADRRAENGPPPAYFWKSLRVGVKHPVHVVDLGPDNDGTTWTGVADGRNRTMGIRLVNQEREIGGEDELELEIILVTLPKALDGIAAALRALDVKIASNVHVPMAPSHYADRVVELEDQKLPPVGIAHKLGLREETAEIDIPQYSALAKCIREVQDAVDAGAIPLARCLRLAKQSEEKQLAAVAPKAPAAPREKRRTLPGEFAAALAAKLPPKYEAAAALLYFFSGDLKALDGHPTLRDLAEDTGIDLTTGRVKRAEA